MGPLLLPVLVALVAGLAVGALLPIPVHWPAWGLLVAAWLASVAAFRAHWPRATLAAAAAGALAAGWLLGADQAARALAPPVRTLLEAHVGGFAMGTPPRRLAEPMLVEGRLRFDATETESGVQIWLDSTRLWPGTCPEPVGGGIVLTVAGAEASAQVGDWTAGRTIRAPATLRRPATYWNDGLADQEVRLARRGVALSGSVKSGLLVETVAPGTWADETAARVRARVRRALARVGRGDPAHPSVAVANAILIGDRAGLDADIERRLQEAGTYHVIAISGGNIAILAALVMGVLHLAGLRGRVPTTLTIVGLIAYAFITGGGPSVTRATAMAVIYLAVRLIDQRTAAVNAIVLTALLLLLASPLAIFDVGFWLSFGATAAIVVGAASVTLPSHWWLAAPAGLLLASVCAELALAPIGAAVFERVTLAGLLLNFIAIPCMTAVQVGAMAVVALDVAWGGAADLVAWVPHLAGRGLLDSARLVEHWPWLTWRVPPPSPALLVAYYAALVGTVAVAAAGGASRFAALRPAGMAGVAACAVAIGVAPFAAGPATGGRLRVTMFDVGQGDALLVTFPRGLTLLVDAGGLATGGAFDIGDRVIGPALRARGVRRLDTVAITHAHPDHAGGAARLVHDFGVREVWEGVPVTADPLRQALRRAADDAGAVWRTVQDGDAFVVDDVRVRALHPPLPDWERPRVRNDDSIVLEVRYGDVAFVLTGDIGRDVEQALLPRLTPAPLVVLKVPHHGSATSSGDALLDSLRPAAAFIGVGRLNTFGHPAPAVLSRYAARAIPVYRTDRDGQIDFLTDGQTVDVETYAGRRAGNTKTTKTTKRARRILQRRGAYACGGFTDAS